MLVYDVIHIVRPGCATSYRPGRRLVESHGSLDTADACAAMYNRCRYLTDGHEYAVEIHDELCFGRASLTAEPDNERPCKCQRSHAT